MIKNHSPSVQLNMNDLLQQKKWAEELGRDEQMMQRSQLPLTTRQKYLAEELQYRKKELNNALISRDTQLKTKSLERMIAIRAEQAALEALGNGREQGALSSETMRLAIRGFYTDCYTLLQALGEIKV